MALGSFSSEELIHSFAAYPVFSSGLREVQAAESAVVNAILGRKFMFTQTRVTVVACTISLRCITSCN